MTTDRKKDFEYDYIVKYSSNRLWQRSHHSPLCFAAVAVNRSDPEVLVYNIITLEPHTVTWP